MPTYSIRYCAVWNYLPYATRLVEEITFMANYNAQDFHLIEGGRGEFTIWKDDEQIYSKSQLDNFPNGNDIVKLLWTPNVYKNRQPYIHMQNGLSKLSFLVKKPEGKNKIMEPKKIWGTSLFWSM